MAGRPPKKLNVEKIQNMIASGMSLQQVADKMGVSRQTIYNRLKFDEPDYKEKVHLTPHDPNGILVDPKTGYAVSKVNDKVIGKIGDERVSAFIEYHMHMMEMRQGVDKSNVPDLYNRFYAYLKYCAEHAIMPNNMNAYYAIGINKQDVSYWKLGQRGTPDHKQFAEDITGFFASVHEQAPTEGLMNVISAMFWQKAHDGMVEASKLEVHNYDPLGEKKSAEDIAKDYAEVELPD